MPARIAAVAAGLLLLALTGCAGTATTAPSGPASDQAHPPAASMSPAPLTPSGSPVDVPQARWNAIAQDLSARGVAGTPTLVSSVAVTWNSGALGCPQPGMSYTQETVPGMRIVVAVAGVQYDYRFGRSDTPVLCPGALRPSTRP
ncbi:hypothetical protein GCM10022240_15630 [Microbacterium kribbense]|uniref:Uncharacterized protein n=1 Tax=Microbacterium kribbense TaxID=433645 RepID=A0ABP7GJK4_9MICO